MQTTHVILTSQPDAEPYAANEMSRLGWPVRLVRRLALETVSGLLGLYAATVTVHALYNLLVSGGLAARVLGYLFPAAVIVVWRCRLSAGHMKEGTDCADV